MLIHLIRHGMTRNGKLQRYEGATDSPLSEEGLALLRQASFSPSFIFCSPLLRARETASVLFPDAAVELVSDLREMNFGSFESRGWWEMENDSAYRAWVDGGCTGRCPGGEDLAEFSARVTEAFRSLVQSASSTGAEEIAVIAHGGVQMAVMDCWGTPRGSYFSWQTPCGEGLLLDASGWPVELRFLGRESFHS